jgi:hypothetical protein
MLNRRWLRRRLVSSAAQHAQGVRAQQLQTQAEVQFKPMPMRPRHRTHGAAQIVGHQAQQALIDCCCGHQHHRLRPLQQRFRGRARVRPDATRVQVRGPPAPRGVGSVKRHAFRDEFRNGLRADAQLAGDP